MVLGSVSHLGGSSGHDKTCYHITKFKSPMTFEKSELSRVLFMLVKCTTCNERKSMMCFRKNFTFLLLLSCVRYDPILF